MPEENRKTLKDRLLEGGIKDRQFIASSKDGEKFYTILDYNGEAGKLLIKYKNNRRATIDIKTHANDLEIATELKEKEFYRVASRDKDYVLFCDNKKLIDVDGRELDQTKIRGLIHIKNPQDYISSLRQDSQKSEME